MLSAALWVPSVRDFHLNWLTYLAFHDNQTCLWWSDWYRYHSLLFYILERKVVRLELLSFVFYVLSSTGYISGIFYLTGVTKHTQAEGYRIFCPRHNKSSKPSGLRPAG